MAVSLSLKIVCFLSLLVGPTWQSSQDQKYLCVRRLVILKLFQRQEINCLIQPLQILWGKAPKISGFIWYGCAWIICSLLMYITIQAPGMHGIITLVFGSKTLTLQPVRLNVCIELFTAYCTNLCPTRSFSLGSKHCTREVFKSTLALAVRVEK